MFARGYESFLTGCGVLAGLAIVVLAMMTTVDVVIRNLGVGNFPWLLEVAEYTIYITTFLAAPWVLHMGAHVRVDLLINAVPPTLSRIMEFIVNCLGAVISLFLIRHGMAVVQEAIELNAIVVKQLAVPEWILLLVIPVSGTMLLLEFILRGLRSLSAQNRFAADGEA